MAMQPGNSRRSSGLVLWGGIIVFGMIIVSFPTVMVAGVGMLPTLVAFLVDRTDEKFATFCVGGINFCGVFPQLMTLWNGEHTINAAMNILADVFVVATMYGAAAFAWMLFMSLPPVIASVLNVMSQTRLASLRSVQRHLVEEWGPEVAGEDNPPPPDTDSPPEPAAT